MSQHETRSLAQGGSTRSPDPPTPSVGLLGGAFDPPHNGHLVVAREAQTQLALDRLLIVVTGEAPHKTVETAAQIRLGLARVAFRGLEGVAVSPVELERKGPSYTLDTVLWARDLYGETTFVIGADEFMSFLSWHEPERVLAATRLAVATRPGFPAASFEPVLSRLGQPDRVRFFSVPEIPISSSDVRQRVREGSSIDGMVPSSVAQEISRLSLYCDASRRDAVPSD